MKSRARITYFACDSIMISADVWPVALLGPSSMKKFGKPGTMIVRNDSTWFDHTSRSRRPSRPDDVDVVGDVERPKPGRFDDDVDRVQCAGRVANAVGFDLRDAVAHQVHVVAIERRQVVVRDAAAFAARLVVGRQARAQLGIA